MSSTPRASQQPWSVPATQNTAPVIKFRCLYTHDVRRKAKRWQDGYLRFHTFNKRVMVYDTTGNFIGDLHWRQDEPLQDGDELELDRGVMIQVCESIERTETDISVIYSGKKSQGSPTQPAERPTPIMRPSTGVRPSISSQPTRSLNDLLGIKKTVPTTKLVSPFEERNPPRPNENVQRPSERAPKRQKIIPSDDRTREPMLPRINRVQPAVVGLSSPPRPPNPALPGREVVERVKVPPKPLPESNTVSSENTNPKIIDKPSRSEFSASSSGAGNPPEITGNSLRLSTSKPRKKLLYRGLLPSQPTGMPTSGLEPPLVIDLTASKTPPPATDYTPSASTMRALDEVTGEFADHPSLRGGEKEPRPVPAARHSAHVKNASIARSSGLRKAYSDPSALTSINGIRTRTVSAKSPLTTGADEENPPEQGPWTSEALYLFDFWPPGRPKPD
ncbi:hypothetical protein FE257_009060 [Aspergillus nanangensis]|uniref:5'-3' DNA helicase ZGRF1-like N-terminal domain-containing protein n=1 Tax=Aspergillus nanangensis TaxID=2582783 RepID=A0AAD4GYK3_ASPNN|nr:hypothetical protein FE257_009060 [Aspergillus nanangensis]